MRKLLVVFLAVLLLMSGCNVSNDTISGQFNSIYEVLPATSKLSNNGEIITTNYLINIHTKDKFVINDKNYEGYDFRETINMRNLMSQFQYYNDRIIIGAINAGGESLELYFNENKQIESNFYHYNVLYYDEIQKQYIVQARGTGDGDIDGFKIMDEQMKELSVIPNPVSLKDMEVALIMAYNLDTFIYFGPYEGSKFQLLKYNLKTHSWEKLKQIIDEDEFEGYGDILYSNKYPDWIGISIDQLTNLDYETKTINKTFFYNTQTKEIISHPMLGRGLAPVVSMPYMKNSVSITKDQIILYDTNPYSPQIIAEYFIENLNPNGTQYIGEVIQFIEDKYIIFGIPDGYVKYDIVLETSEYIYRYGE